MKSDVLLLREASFGDVLTRIKFPFVHKGVYLGNNHVLHNTPSGGEHITNVIEFANGRHVSVRSVPEHEKLAIWQRMEVLIKPKSYDAFENNCEHTVTRLTEGRAYSTQLIVTVVVLLGLVAFAVASRK